MNLTICNTAVRQLDGLYSLNDLHQAAGGEERHRPNFFLGNKQTKELADVIQAAGNPASKTVIGKGKQQGTYVCRELVIAYAAWISAAFHLQVIRCFLDVKVGAGETATTVPAIMKKPIKQREDLSFVKRDEHRRLINWTIERDPHGDWYEGVQLGQRFFDEVAELALHDEKEALLAVETALSGGEDFRRGPGTEFTNRGWGAECGFVKAIARCVIDGLRVRRMQLGAPTQ